MDQNTAVLLEALKVGAQEGAEMRLYRRGKLPGLFAQRNSDAASQALEQKLLEMTRTETEGKATIEWVRITPKGLEFLLDSESPVRALDELRAALAGNQQGLPAWAAQMQERIDDLSKQFAAEVAAMRSRLDQMAQQVEAAIARIETAQQKAAPPNVPWGGETLAYLERRKQVGLGTRCPLADLYTTLKEKHADMSIKEFHTGLKQLQLGKAIELLPSAGNGDTPGPEYALLDGPALYYYVARAGDGN
jgi:hypothetical protein